MKQSLLEKETPELWKDYLSLVESGATRAEIAETLAVTLLMNGGPADVWSREIISEVFGE